MPLEIFNPSSALITYEQAAIHFLIFWPDISRVKAFYLNGKLGAALHKGNWHWPPIPLGETVKFVLIRKGTLWETTEIKELGELGIDELKISL